jgi:hypothetical protein
MDEEKKELIRFFVFGIFIVLALAFLFSLENVPQPYAVLPVGTEVMVSRSLSDFSGSGTAFDVELEVLTRENLTAIGIMEKVPSGWTIGSCSQGEYVINNSARTLDILIFTGSDNINSRNITYRVTPNSDAGIFNGTWRSASVDLEGLVVGDSILAEGCVDTDSDGYDAIFCGGDDCNDGNRSIHPGASDNDCNRVDEDCNGNADNVVSDGDGDGVGDRCDYCRNSPSGVGFSFNSKGCALPRYSKFDSNWTTAFYGYDNLTGLNNLLLGISGRGAVFFINKSSLNVEGVDFDSHVNILTNSIALDANNLTFLRNKSAILQFFDVHFVEPKIFRDGIECVSPNCNLTSYANATLVYNISHFSTYTISDAYVAPDTGGSTGGSSGGGGSGGGGGSSGGAGTCIINWICNDWNICENGKSTRECFDMGACGVVDDKPITVQDCECTEYWVCDPWEKGDDGREVRDCVDVNGCGTSFERPDTMRDIAAISSKYKKLLYLLAILILLIIVIAIYFVRKQEFGFGGSAKTSAPNNKSVVGNVDKSVSVKNVGSVGNFASVNSSGAGPSKFDRINPFKKNDSVGYDNKKYFS